LRVRVGANQRDNRKREGKAAGFRVVGGYPREDGDEWNGGLNYKEAAFLRRPLFAR
jgi:hypothetical protein